MIIFASVFTLHTNTVRAKPLLVKVAAFSLPLHRRFSFIHPSFPASPISPFATGGFFITFARLIVKVCFETAAPCFLQQGAAFLCRSAETPQIRLILFGMVNCISQQAKRLKSGEMEKITPKRKIL